MYKSAARIIPNSTATVRSANTVRANVTSQTATSVFVCRSSTRNLVPLAHVERDDEEDRGEHRHGHVPGEAGAMSSTPSSVSAWIIPETGVRAPDRTFVAVRAIAPVAGRPPNIGDTTLATPCATSSTFGLCRSPLMRSATTADISDSIAPRRATVSAGDSSVRTSEGWKAGI